MSSTPTPFESSVVSMSSQQVVEKALEFLPPALVASMVGVKDPGQVRKWRSGAQVPTPAALEKLRFMLTQALAIEDAESASVATAWLTSANSRLAYQLPIKAIGEVRYRDVANAGSAYLHGYAG